MTDDGDEIYHKYAKVCEQAANDDQVFGTFKQNPDFVYMLEHVSFSQGKQYLNKITSHFLNNILDNDRFGSPKIFDYGNNIECSPTTLRYISTGLVMFPLFQKVETNIVEIGGGYGGQCKVLYDLSQLFGIPISSYTILDLEKPNMLQRKYLSKLGLGDVECMTIQEYEKKEDPKKIDLLISNYALGEISEHYRQQYLGVLEKSTRGYVIWNDSSNKIPSVIQEKPRYNVSPEFPQTGKDNVVIIW